MKKRVLLIHTGGTIGMVRDNESGVLKPDGFYKSLMEVIPELSDVADIRIKIPFLKDSSELSPENWIQIAELIEQEIDKIDGVVITHGTDTLAYTASALSYMLHNVPVPVILTGAQKPLCELRSDARANLINSVEIATSNEIREVAIFFDDKLFRGNRTIKSHINHFSAFSSPNYPPLAQVGINIDIYSRNTLKTGGLFHIFKKMDTSIAVLKIFPGCSVEHFQPQDSTRAIIIMTFGAGNVPTESSDLEKKVKHWIEKGKIVVLMSETKAGQLNPSLYESGNKLTNLGAIDSGDMTFEASITKLMFLLGQYEDASMIKKNFMKSLAGERTILN